MISSSLLGAKFKAFAIHMVISAVVAAVVAAFVLHYWFPYGTFRLLGGLELLILVIVCDVILGPLLSFVVFNPVKPTREKMLDFSLIALIQLIGLSYGLHATAQNRLAFVAFVADRYELVSAGELDDNMRAKAPNPLWRESSLFRHHVVNVELTRPDNPDYVDSVLKELDGEDLRYDPQRYRSLESALPEISRRMHSMSELSPEKRKIVDEALGRDAPPETELGWFLVNYQKKFWTLIVDRKSGMPIRGVDVDPDEANS